MPAKQARKTAKNVRKKAGKLTPKKRTAKAERGTAAASRAARARATKRKTAKAPAKKSSAKAARKRAAAAARATRQRATTREKSAGRARATGKARTAPAKPAARAGAARATKQARKAVSGRAPAKGTKAPSSAKASKAKAGKAKAGKAKAGKAKAGKAAPVAKSGKGAVPPAPSPAGKPPSRANGQVKQPRRGAVLDGAAAGRPEAPGRSRSSGQWPAGAAAGLGRAAHPGKGRGDVAGPALARTAGGRAVEQRAQPGARESAAPARRPSRTPEPGAARPGRGDAGSSPPPSLRRSGSVSPGMSLRETARLSIAREPARVLSIPLPTLTPQRRPSVEERSAAIEKRLDAQTEDFRRRYIDSFDMSWIYHDSALEGVVYTFDELRAALSGQAPPALDSSLQPAYDDIRRHKEAIAFVRDFATKKRLPVTVDVLKKIYLILHPEEGDVKTVKYRKDVPQHRLYFHEYAPPDKIAYKVRQIIDWLNDPETRKTRNGVRIAARAHYDLLRVYPFATDSGRVSRLFMNLLLLRSGLPPSIIHSTERQRYYEALKGSATTVLQMVQEAVENALGSVEKLLDEHENKKRAFVS